MTDRSAVAPITGYSYQFLHTVKKILDGNSDTDQYTVEGIEDLDVYSGDSTNLIQYKYHERQSYKNSIVAEPIGLMLNHFLENQNKSIKYRLFIHLNNDSLPELTIELLSAILKLNGTKKHIKLEVTNDLLSDFFKQFNWEPTPKFDKLEQDILSKLQTTFRVNTEIANYVYLSNAIKLINDLARNKNQNNRIIKKSTFIEKLEHSENLIYCDYLLMQKGFKDFKKHINTVKKSKSINKHENNPEYIIQINSSRSGINSLIVDLCKKFCYKDNKAIYKPITFIINGSDNYDEFKKRLHLYMTLQSETIKINDGYECYSFNYKVFNEEYIAIKKDNNTKYNIVSYNFKLIHLNTFNKHDDKIVFTNPAWFIVDRADDNQIPEHHPQFYLNNLNTEQIIELIGE